MPNGNKSEKWLFELLRPLLETPVFTLSDLCVHDSYLDGGLAEALTERPRSGQPPKVTPALEAKITSLACSETPAGAARWTLSLLNDTLVSLEYVDTISNESIRQVLKKVNSSPG